MAFVNVMYDMSQFVVFVPVLYKSSVTLSSYVILKFRFFHFVVLNDDNSSKDIFITMTHFDFKL